MYNKFWRSRARHGPTPTFQTADELWAAAQAYFEWSDANPWMRTEQLKHPTAGTDANALAELPTARPYSTAGLCLHLGMGENWFRTFKAKEHTEDFREVIDLIETIIRTQKSEGAAVGAFNANIISRELGLVDKKAIDAKVNLQQVTGMIVK